MDRFESINHPTPVENNTQKFSAKLLLKYPIAIVFFVFIALVSIVDIIMPDKDISALENKPLAQNPPFNLDDFWENKWTLSFTEYTRDQFAGRDNWISLYSFLESAQGKIENNGVWYAKDDYQISENFFAQAPGSQDLFPDDLGFGLDKYQLATLPHNIDAISALGSDFNGMVTAMVLPSPANVLASKLRGRPTQFDENAMLDYMYAQFAAGGVEVIDVRNAFEQNLDNDIFYKTDHHWTTTGGAWLAYEEFVNAKGIEAVKPSDAYLKRAENFLGTNFAKSKKPFTQADVIEYYDLQNTLTLYTRNRDNSLTETDTTIMDYEKLNEYDKYAAFLHGNNGYSVLQGIGSGTILVIKDSYANCFVPYLAANYEKIGIVDPRAETEVNSIIKSGEWDEILILYGFETFSSENSIYKITAK